MQIHRVKLLVRLAPLETRRLVGWFVYICLHNNTIGLLYSLVLLHIPSLCVRASLLCACVCVVCGVCVFACVCLCVCMSEGVCMSVFKCVCVCVVCV